MFEMTTHRLVATQLVPRSRDEVFAFFATPDNLARLTPPAMHFDFRSADREMRAGLSLDYRLRPMPLLPVPVGWQSRIDAFDAPHGFHDIQSRGPYRLWDHHHTFEAVAGGTLVRDEVEYELPLGPLGSLAHRIAVRPQLAEIFRFRARTIESIFERPDQPPTGRTIAVAGGTGFVGGAIARELRRRGHKVVVLSHRAEAARGPLADDVEIRHADANGEESLSPALAGVDALVIALAFPNSPMESPRRGQTFELIDARGTERLVAAAREAGVEQLVYVSGAGAAPDASRHWFRAKWRAEEAVRGSDLAWTIIRPTWIFGPRDVSLNRFLGFARSLPFVPLTNTGRQLLAPVFVDDAARLAADSLEDPAAACRLFELGGPDVRSMRDIIGTALRAARIRRPILPGPTPLLKLAAWPLRFLPEPPLTPDAIDFVNQPAVVDTAPLLDAMPRQLTTLEDALASYLGPGTGPGTLQIDGQPV
jgi:NADH dehydrogenase